MSDTPRTDASWSWIKDMLALLVEIVGAGQAPGSIVRYAIDDRQVLFHVSGVKAIRLHVSLEAIESAAEAGWWTPAHVVERAGVTAPDAIGRRAQIVAAAATAPRATEAVILDTGNRMSATWSFP